MPDGSQKLSPQKERARLKQLLRERARTPKTAPVSYAQERLWFFEQLVPPSAVFCESRAVRISVPVDRDVLQSALGEIVRRHEILRTSFAVVDGRPVQRIAPTLRPQVTVVDLSRSSGAGQKAAIDEAAAEQASRPFDLSRAPLFRMLLLELGGGGCVVVTTMHHIVADGWSVGVLLRELLQLYFAHWTGGRAPLTAVPMQYAEFARRQRRQVEEGELAAQLPYWRRRLEGLEVLELPADRPRPAVQSFRGASHAFEIPVRLARTLVSVGRAEGCTPFMVLLAAFQLLLMRYTGREDVSVGSPVAGRHGRETEELIGFFVNMLVLRTSLAGDPGFRELLARVRETCLGAFAHDGLPFAKLVEELRPRRSLSREPFFQTAFVFHKEGMEVLELPGLAPYPLRGTGTSKYDLTLLVREGTDAWSGSIEFNTDLFEHATIERMCGHFESLLRGVAQDPDRRLSEMPLLGERERRRVLSLGAAPAAGGPSPRCVHEQFEAQARRTPAAAALGFEVTTLRYGELDDLAERLARRLVSCGVGPETRVGIFLERSPEMVVAILGILKAGGAYVPMDVDTPRERLALMLQDARAPVVVTRRRHLDRLLRHGGERICLDAGWEASAPREGRRSHVRVTGENLAYVIYTSGSTGRPKGVEIRHASLANLVRWHRQEYDVTARDRATQLAAPGFDASVWELWPYLTAGASVHFPDEETCTSPARLQEYLSARGITLCYVPTALAEALFERPWPEGPAPRVLLTGGDRLRGRPLPDLPFSVVNLYGPTESTVITTRCTVSPARGEEGPPPIGRPISNVSVYVLDRSLNPVPVGIPGELCIGGAGLARGYLRRPALTAEKFIPDPFSEVAEARLYRSGDLARWRADGNLEFLGRIDDQVKIRGFRIEPGEVEVALRRHPGIERAVVLAWEATPGDMRLAAYSVAASGSAPGPDELRAHLARRLPGYMVPSAFVSLDDLPQTPGGKVDRKALPPPGREAAVSSEYAAPRTELERSLADIWSRLLRVERVGLHDGFFELGGHSLLAVRLAVRVHEDLQVELPLPVLFEDPTIAGLARAIERIRADGAAPAATVSDLERAAVLDPSIRADGRLLSGRPVGAAVFLTGATGFLGAFLLHRLLLETDADVHCLVRSPDPEKGHGRIRGALASYSLWDEAFGPRIVAVPGDLGRPLLGLGRERFERLAAEIDVVYHNGARVDILLPYAALEAANVLGTREVLRFACEGRVKPVHLVSTLSVFPAGAAAGGRAVYETDDPEPRGLSDGYSQSKWVAEKLGRLARSRGIPVCIYRPGRVTGDSRTGISNANDALFRLIRSCIDLGSVPRLREELRLDMTPVDYVSDAIVHLSRRDDSAGRTYHLVNPRSVPWRELVERIRAAGYPLREIPMRAWAEERVGAAPAGIVSGTASEMIDRLQLPAVDCRNTLEGLSGTAIACPPAAEPLIDTYLARFAGGESARNLS